MLTELDEMGKVSSQRDVDPHTLAADFPTLNSSGSQNVEARLRVSSVFAA